MRSVEAGSRLAGSFGPAKAYNQLCNWLGMDGADRQAVAWGRPAAIDQLDHALELRLWKLAEGRPRFADVEPDLFYWRKILDAAGGRPPKLSR